MSMWKPAEAIIAHCEGKPSYTFAITSKYVHQTKYADFVDLALEHYNSLFGTCYLRENCKCDLEIDMCHYRKCNMDDYASLDAEIIIWLDAAKEVPKETALSEEKCEEPAELCDDAETPPTSSTTDGNQIQAKEHELLRWRNKYLEKKSPEELIREYQNFEVSDTQLEAIMVEIARKAPNVSMRVMLSDITLYDMLPRVIEKVPELGGRMAEFIERLGLTPMARSSVGEILIKRGLISDGIAVGYNQNVITNADCPDVHVRKLWIMWMSRDIGPLYYNILAFLRRYEKVQIGAITLSEFYQLLYSVRKHPPERSKKTRFPLQFAIDPEQLPYFRVICLVGVFLFTQGYVSEYTEFRMMLNPLETHYLDKVKLTVDITKGVPEWTLYQKTAMHNLQTLKPPKCPIHEMMLVIGDEFTILNAFEPIDCCKQSMFHPMPRLSITKIAPNRKCMMNNVFWSQIPAIGMYAGICLSIGTWDIMNSLPKMLQQGTIKTVQEGIELLAYTYALILLKIHKLDPQLKICVREIESPEELIDEQIDRLNEAVRQCLPSFATWYESPEL